LSLGDRTGIVNARYKARKQNNPTKMEDTMTANTQTTTRNQTEVGYEVSKFAFGTGMAMAGLIGLWGTACLVSALVSVGPLSVVKGYFTAMLG